MAFACPKQEELERKRATLEAITDVVSELRKEYENIYCEPTISSKCNCPSTQPDQQQQNLLCEPPNIMVCYKIGKAMNQNKIKKNMKRTNENQKSIRLKQSKSRELRAGIMYVGCDCEKRNGLQDDCQRTECHGSPQCLTMPYPTCVPSQFCNGGSYGTSQNRTDNKPVVDAVEYEYQCFPGIEKPNDIDMTCNCCDDEENQNYFEECEDQLVDCQSFDNFDLTQECYECKCEAVPLHVTDCRPLEPSQCICCCEVCNMPLCYHR